MLHHRDTRDLCVVCLEAEHAQSAFEGTDFAHCERLPLWILCSRLPLFEEGARGSGPAAAKAEW